MKSKTSCFNWTICKKDLFRGMPLWGLWLLLWLVLLPLHLMTRDWYDMADIRYYLLSIAAMSSHFFPFFFGIGTACVLFSYLYKSRSANFFGALPLRREYLFLTKYVTGILYCLLPNVLVAVLTMLLGAAHGKNLAGETLTWFGTSCLMYLFFFSFAAFCAMIVGHLAALPALYAMALFTGYVVENIVKELMQIVIYGYRPSSRVWLEFLSPVVHCLGEVQVESIWSEPLEQFIGYAYHGWTVILGYAAVGLIFGAVAFRLYQHRRMESAGDVIAVRHLKPVVLYCFTVGCGLVLGWILSAVLFDGVESPAFLPVSACLLVSAAVGYFGGQMLLHKSLRVFRSRYVRNCGVVCALFLAVLCCFHFDAFGISYRVPAVEELQSVSFGVYGSSYIQDPVQMEQVIGFHRQVLDCQEETLDILRHDEDRWHPVLRIRYYYKDGSTLFREYRLPVNRETAVDETSLAWAYDMLSNDPEIVVAREVPDDLTADSLRYAYVYNNHGGSLTIDRAEALNLLESAVLPDLRDTDWMKSYFRDDYTENQETVEEARVDQVVPADTERTDLYLEFHFTVGDREGDEKSTAYFTVNPKAVRTMAALEALGITP